MYRSRPKTGRSPQRAWRSILIAAAALCACGDDPPADVHLDAGASDSERMEIAVSDSSESDSGEPASDTGTDSLSEADVPDLGTDVESDIESGIDSDLGAPDGRPLFVECLGRDFDPSFSGEWDNALSAITALGDPGHSIQDAIGPWPSGVTEIEGKFAYGLISADLQDETIAAYIDDCTEWVELGVSRTDSDGRARVELDAAMFAQPGRYALRMVVQGDGSIASGYALLVPEGSQFIVTDIDGTLTTGDTEVVMELVVDLFGGEYVPEAYEGAQETVSAYAAAGYEILYLTARPYLLSDVTRQWLADEGFPRGTVGLSEFLPGFGDTAAYKRDYLLAVLADHGVYRAYGNADTDIAAYLDAGISPEDVYIIGDLAGDRGTQPVGDYPSHLDAIDIDGAEQPFRRE